MKPINPLGDFNNKRERYKHIKLKESQKRKSRRNGEVLNGLTKTFSSHQKTLISNVFIYIWNMM